MHDQYVLGSRGLNGAATRGNYRGHEQSSVSELPHGDHHGGCGRRGGGSRYVLRRPGSVGGGVLGPAAASASSVSSLEALLAGPTGSSGAPVDSTQIRAHILSTTRLSDAIGVARPLMANTVGRLDMGSAVLALWASKSLTWDDLESIPETSPALFRKDPDAERGKRFCVTGTIQQIRAEKSLSARITDDRSLPLIERASPTATAALEEPAPPAASDSANVGLLSPDFLAPSVDLTIPDDGKVFVAVIVAKPEPSPEGAHPARTTFSQQKDALIAEIIAVRSTGALVDNSEVRACGVLTGVTMPADSGSSPLGETTQHRIVGMFDLPENHGGSGEIARHGN